MAINGTVNADTLNGTNSSDTIYGGGGNDSIFGGSSADALYGGDGDDTLNGGGAFPDSLYGEAGNDVLKDDVSFSEHLYAQSVQGNDSLIGGDGNDTIYAGSGANTIDGGLGVDTLDFSTFNTQSATIFGGITIAKTNGAIVSYTSVVLNSSYSYGSASSFSNIENIVGSSFNDSLVGNNNYAQSILGGAGDDTLVGDLGVYAHTLKGEAGNDTIVGGYLGSYDGGLGVDTLLLGDTVSQNGPLDIAAGTYKSFWGTVSFTGFEIYQGGAGSNYILGGTLADTIYGGYGSDSIEGGAGNDLIYGDLKTWVANNAIYFNDTINGGDGDDTISGGIGVNKLDGGAGTDTYLIGPVQYESQTQIVNLSSSSYTISPNEFGRLAVVSTTTVAGYYAGAAPGWSGNNYDTISNFENASASALTFTNDVILIGNEFANVLTAGPGRAVLIGGAGNDTLYGAGGSANASYHIYEIRGGLGDDLLYGNNSSTLFVADAGTDTLIGLGGKAGLKVSEGAKAIGTLNSSWAPSISPSNMQGTAVINTNGYSASVIATGYGSYELSNASSTIAVSLTGSNGNDKLTGGSGADTISGDLGSDLIYGGAGNDSITAEWGSDTIYGEAGNDVIRGGTIVSASWNGNLFVSGGDGNDTITGGVLSDTLLGDAGNDSIAGGDGNDVISGGIGINTLDGGLGIDEISYSGASLGVVVDLNSSYQNTFYSNDTLSNFENISGGAHNDTLRGNSGANILSGGLGDDYLHGRGGNDTLLGGAGFDYGDFTSSGSEQSNFGLTVNRDGSITVTDKTALAAEGTDTLLSVEGLQFMGPTKVVLSRNFNEAAINTYSTDYQSKSEITKLSDGSIVVVWNSAGQDGSLGSIVAKKFSPNGIQDGYEFIVNTTKTGNQISAAVSALADGGYVVVWDSVGQDGSGDGIYFQRFDAKNNTVGAETRANTTTTNNQYLPDVVGLKNGNFVISWTSTDPALSNLYNKTYFQIFNSTGNAVATPGHLSERELISNNPTEENSIAKLTALADGGFVVTRNFNNFLSGVPNINSVSDIVAQRFDANGARVQSDFRINDKIQDYDSFANTDQSRYKQDLVALSGGGFAVAWTDSPDYLLDSVVLKLRFYNDSGVADGSPITVGWAANGATTNTLKVNASYRPSLTELSNKDILVTWVNGDGDISAQRLNSAHQKIGSHFVVNTTLTDYQVNPQVQALSNGGFMVLWDAGGEIYAQSYDANGNSVTGADLNLTITGWDGPQSLLGGGGNDSINGVAGNDTLDGGAGIDTLVGGSGDDTYYVRSSLTTVTELANGGSDTVVSSIDYSLVSGVENLLLSGSVIQGSGNELNNIITGNESNNSLSGGGGNDSLVGLGGADTLTADGGDTLVGGLGNDVLFFSGNIRNTGQGDAGSDQFIVNSASALTIKDFSGNDALEFSQLTSINSITQGTGSALAKGSIQYAVSGSSTILYVGLDDSLGSDTQITLENFSKPLSLGLSDGKSNALSLHPYATITDNISGVATGQVTYSIIFDSVVTGLTSDDFLLQNGTLSQLTASTDGKKYTALVSPNANSSGVLKLSLSKNAVTNDIGIGNSESNADSQYFLTKAGTLPSTIDLGASLIAGQNFTLRYGVTYNNTAYYFADNNYGNDFVSYNTAPLSKSVDIYNLTLPGYQNNINGVSKGLYDVFANSSSQLGSWGKGYYWTSNWESSAYTPTNYYAINLGSYWSPSYAFGTGYVFGDRLDAQLAYAVKASSGSAVSVLSTANQIAEASGNTTQVVLMRASAGAEQQVGLTFGGTATFNSDYKISGNYTSVGGKNYAVFASGSDIAVITISGSRDQVVESPEMITVSLDSNNSSYLLADSAVNINLVDSSPQGSVLITGELSQGSTLTASNTIVDSDGISGDISYQWYANDSLIVGATGSQFTLGQSQVSKSIKVVANYLDGTGFVETLASSPSIWVVNVNDDPVGSVSISGIPMRGQILTADTSLLKDLDGLGQLYYQWYEDDQEIFGATNNNFRATAAQANKKLSVGVSYQDLMGKNELVSSPNVLVFDKENSAPSFGTSLRAELGYLENQTPKILASSVQILDDDLALENYAGATLTLARNGAANAEDIFTNINQLGTLLEGGSLIVSQNHIGTVIKNSGGTLNLIFNENATQSLVNLALQSIAYSNSSNEPPTSVQIDWLFNDGNTNKLQGPGGALTASGRTLVSIESVNDLPEILNDPLLFVPENSLSIITLSAIDLDNEITSWSINSGADANYFSIDSATGALRFKAAQNYDASGGLKDFSVSVRASDSKGGSTDKLFLVRLTGVNESPIVSNEFFSIKENNPLGSSVGTLVATDPESSALTYSIADGNTDIDGDGFSAFVIDSSTGAITVNDVDDLNFEGRSSFNLTVLAFDGALSSSAIATVNLTNVNEAPTGTVTISGTAIQGNTLTLISSSLNDPDGAGTTNVQWLLDGVSISGATTSSYTLTTSDAGKSISARLSYTDGGGYEETVTTSAVTVAGLNAGVTISGFDKITGEDGNSAVFTVELSKEPLDDVTINFVVTDTTEASLSTSSLTFTPLNWNTAQDLIVNGLDDYDNDGNIAYNLIATISTNDVDYKRVLVSPITLTNNDDSNDAPLVINGTEADNDIFGNDGADSLYGDDGNDDIRGGRGADSLYGENGADSLYGQDGNDELYGGYDNDSLWAGVGNDVLYGEAGKDILYGEAGNDTLDGGTGADTMTGGVGNDTYFVDNEGDVIDDQGATNDQDNVIVTATIKYKLAANVARAELQEVSGDASLTGNELANRLRGNTSNNTLEGGAGNDVIEAGAGDDLIIGGNGAGDDTYTGGDGVDTVKYTSATDSIVVDLSASLNQAKSLTSDNAGIGVDQLFGVENVIAGSYNDVVTGNSQNNSISGGSGNDTLAGLAGTDTLDGGVGNDNLIGGAGDDTYVVDSSTDTITEVAGGGVDNIQSSVTFTIAPFANVENLSLTASSNINATGNAAVNVLSGNTGNNILDGAAGNDSINGGLGNDWLIGGLGNDTMTGGVGNDAYFVDAAGDVIIESFLDNTPDQKTFWMGQNNDVVIASVSYTLTAGAAVDDMMAVGPGTGASTNAAINLTGNELAQGLIGNDAANILTGNDGDDGLVGMGGNDVLIGGAGNDYFFGGAGNDTMNGGTGNDAFFFNFGSYAAGNFLSQPYSLLLTGGNDTIDGGEGSEDTIILIGSLSDYTLTKVSATDYKISVKTTLSGPTVAETATFKNVERLGFTSSLDDVDKNKVSFTLLSSLPIASPFNDTLTGGNGNDTIDGGAGNDSINGGAGNDWLMGGLGNDYFVFNTTLGVNNIDTLIDFTSKSDVIQLSRSIFTEVGSVGPLSRNAFYASANASMGNDADDRIIYNTTTRAIYYDADGSGSVEAVQFAIVGTPLPPNISFTDFVVVG